MFYSFIRGLIYWPVRLLFRLRFEGRDKLPQTGGVIMCSNHVSYLDPVAIGLMCKQHFSFMAKEELFRKKLFGGLIRKLGAFPVKRDANDLSAIKNALQILKSGGALIMFPEGTRNKGGDGEVEAKAGVAMFAAKTDSTVVPIAIIGEGKLFRRTVLRVCEPIVLPKEQYGKLSQEEYKDLSVMIMQRIKEARDR